MADRIRTFVAIDFPAAPLCDVLDDLSGMGRPVRVASVPLHLTLKFLGETDPKTVDRIAEVLRELAGRHSAFDVELVGVDAFPRRERPSVVWVGLTPAEPLVALASELESHLEPLGFPRESRPFQPHVTIARVKGRPPRELTGVFDLYGKERFGTISIRQLMLYQSDLRPQGPQYTVLSTAVLRTIA